MNGSVLVRPSNPRPLLLDVAPFESEPEREWTVNDM